MVLIREPTVTTPSLGGSLRGAGSTGYEPTRHEPLPGRRFDLDGTLLRGTTVSLLLAQWLGRASEISELERAFRAHEISNSVVADTSAAWVADQSIAEAWRS
jgi:hypothetical protein